MTETNPAAGAITQGLATGVPDRGINLAVGVIGSEENPANLMFGGVLAVGIVGAVVARFRPRGMARALVSTAVAQTTVGVIAPARGGVSQRQARQHSVLRAAR